MNNFRQIDLSGELSFNPDSERLKDKADLVELYSQEVSDESAAQVIDVLYIPPESTSDITMILPVAWSDYPSREFNVLRQVELANATGAEILVPGFPGIGPTGARAKVSPLTPKQSEQLKRDQPTLEGVGASTWQAVLQTLSEVHPEIDPIDYLEKRKLIGVGYSQGSSTLQGMLASKPERVRMIQVSHVEMPDRLKPELTLRVYGRFAIDSLSAKRYFNENRVNYPGIKESHKTPNPLNLAKRYLGESAMRLTPAVFAHSSVAYDLKQAYQSGRLTNHTLHSIRWAGNSKVSDLAAGLEFGNLISQQTQAEIDLGEFLGDTHALQESYLRYAKLGLDIVRLS